MEIVLIVVLVAAVGAASAFAAAEVVRRRATPAGAPDVTVQAAVAVALTEIREQATAERDAAVRAALEQAAVLQRQQLGAEGQLVREQAAAELAAKKELIDSRIELSQSELRAELSRLGYADQAHLTRDLRSVTDLTPAQIARLFGRAAR